MNRLVDCWHNGLLCGLVLALGVLPVRAQETQDLSVQLSVHAGTYAMEDLEAWQQAEIKAFERLIRLEPAVVDAFPGNWALRGTATYRLWSRLHLGVRGGFSSTGGRVSYADYSGSYTFDQKVRRWYGGPSAEYQVLHIPNVDMKVWGGGYLYVARSSLVTETTLQIKDASDRAPDGTPTLVNVRRREVEESADFHSFAFGAVPEIAITWHPSPVFIRLHIGYDFSFDQDLKRDGESVSLPNVEDPALNWEGVRFGGGVGTRF